VPIPIFESQEKLAQELDSMALSDMDRPHYAKGVHIRTLWDEEKIKLKKLPDHAFEVFRLESVMVNKYGEVTVDKMPITVFNSKPGDEMLVRIWWDKCEVLDHHYKVLASVPRAYTGKTHDIPWLEVFKGFQRKPRSVRHSQFTRMLPPAIQAYLCIESMDERKERIAALMKWCEVYQLGDIAEAISRLDGNVDISMVTAILPLVSSSSRQVAQGFQEAYTPPVLKGAVPDLARYNTLTKGGENA
jgi:hypothetical protein